MRKVFVATGVNANAIPTAFKSRDLEINKKEYIAPICALLDANVSAGDDVLVLINTPKSDWEKNTYTLTRREVKDILAAHNAKGELVAVGEEGYEADALTHSVFMKGVSNLLQEGDVLYADVTFGKRGDAVALLVAANYAQHALQDFRVSTAIYASPEIVDISALFHLLAITGAAKEGEKTKMDKFLDFLII